MEFKLVQYFGEEIISRSNIVTSFSNEINAFFKEKEYGQGLESIYIGVICVNVDFERFFKIGLPKYTKDREIRKNDLEIVVEKSFEYRIKVDYNTFKISTDIQILKILAIEILKSLSVFDSAKIPFFDKAQFKTDFETCIDKMKLISG